MERFFFEDLPPRRRRRWCWRLASHYLEEAADQRSVSILERQPVGALRMQLKNFHTFPFSAFFPDSVKSKLENELNHIYQRTRSISEYKQSFGRLYQSCPLYSSSCVRYEGFTRLTLVEMVQRFVKYVLWWCGRACLNYREGLRARAMSCTPKTQDRFLSYHVKEIIFLRKLMLL